MLQSISITVLVYAFSIITPMMMFHSINAYNYCSGSASDLCKKTKHLMCDTSVLKPEAKYLAHVPLTNKIRSLFIEGHNNIRNLAASGPEMATAMREVIWDSELAYLAEVHSGLCTTTADLCHNTARFQESGQNLFKAAGTERLLILKVINNTFESWLAEKANAGAAFAAKYAPTPTAEKFLLIVNDQVSRIGCAIAYGEYCGEKKERHCYYVTCNYDMKNIVGNRVYMHGDKIASKCSEWETGKSSQYKNLCHNTGKIFMPAKASPKALSSILKWMSIGT